MTAASEVKDMPSPRIRKFNPGTLQSDEEIKTQFVVRNHEFGIVLDVLRGNIDAPSCQHVLVVAPRGRGKTMLLTRAAAEIRTDDHLSKHLLPVQFMEESQEIFSLADFWLDTLFHLGRESARRDPELARELGETHAALSTRWHETSLEEQARAAVLDAAGPAGQETCAHGRESAGAQQERGPRFWLEAPRGVAIGTSGHASRQCYQSIQGA